ncbi:hypothetical protein BUALT_BualtUnG0057300 [Buddleja alternifolia]|uniref:Uncharacterized protein n=1 Tax=Buddleja alternifolia TaxID=168488 RepID=A0AAV6VZV0_9LAMI|nr:hypothetical protein BUALT_BualtUnG0057300 [Buddleja alternifolia]
MFLLFWQLYPAILWFMAYVAAYSQEMVLKARGGDVNYVKHSITLFADFPAVVFHLCRIMVNTKYICLIVGEELCDFLHLFNGIKQSSYDQYTQTFILRQL